jgi:tetratricopeptide (TPR) repeat protein
MRLLTPSLENPIVREVTYDNIQWYQINRSYLRKYFPANIKPAPEIKPALFKKQKSENLFRVFCLGGSSMFGTPYQMTSNIPGILRKQLRRLFPEWEIEVINFGASAINSHVIKRFAGELRQFEPDLILIYMGHNEFYGPDGVGATFLEKKLPIFLSLKYVLRALRIYQVMRNWITSSSARDEQENQERNLMREVSRGSLIQLNSGESERIFKYFRKNLKELISIFQEQNIPIIISDVSSNLLFKPFAFQKKINGQTIDKLLIEVIETFNTGHYDVCLEKIQKIHKLDTTHALLNYWMGRTFQLLGLYDKAKEHLNISTDNDLLKFRAPSQINKIIQEVAAEMQIPFVSANDYISEKSKNKIPLYDLFWEHLHFNSKGYYLVVDVFLKAILELEMLPAVYTYPSFTSRMPFHADSLSICWLDLAYADMGISKLTGKWPFENFKIDRNYLDLESQELKQIVTDVFQRKIVWDEACYKTASFFEKYQRFRDAQTTYEAIIEEYPYNYFAHYHLARLFKEQGKLLQAKKHYLISLNSSPDYLYSRVELGLIEVNLGQFDQAIAHLEKAVVLAGDKNLPAVKANIFYGLSAAFANKRDMQKALEYVNRSLTFLPNYQSAKTLRQQILRYLSKLN